ncbi:MAG: pSer/pThr/pTyr-binding forkhead associated (FHA) protein [Mariniblastus sp.]|jgi:pSer/pThr/pTyr-binding forkhead associated (FHA) protein
MQVVLRVVGGKNDGREITIAVPRFIVGRGDTAHLRPASDLVSREHCEILVADGKVIINDLKSRNGTFVNGKQLEGTHVAKPGDSLRIGRLQFEIVIDPVKASVKKPKVESVVEAAARTANQKKSSLEDSITDWLSDAEEEPGSSERDMIASAETIQLNLEETSVFGTTKRVNDGPDEEEDTESKKKGPKKLPPIPKHQHDSSTTAADDVLRKFFNRR